MAIAVEALVEHNAIEANLRQFLLVLSLDYCTRCQLSMAMNQATRTVLPAMLGIVTLI